MLQALDQFGEPAVCANRVRVLAKIPNDLKQTLLGRRAGQPAGPRTPQQPLPRQL